jgi:TonB family protein
MSATPTLRRRRHAVRRRPQREIALPQSVKIILTPKHRIRASQVAVVLLPLVVVLAGGYYAYKKFGSPEMAEEKPPELQEVQIEKEEAPEPESEAEPEPEEEPEADLPDLLGEDDGSLGPGNAISLDLALGTGSDGMAIAGAGAKNGGGSSRAAAYEPGQADQNPELMQGPNPEMPSKAVSQGVSGSFVATFVVGAGGKVESIQVTGTPQGFGFEEAIRRALQKRRYKPAVAGGVPVPMKIRQPFDFRLE